MEELNENEILKNELEAAVKVRNEAEFNRLIEQCSDFRIVFDITIECAERALRSLLLAKYRLENMMETGLKRMLSLNQGDWSFELGEDARQMASCVTVIENYYYDSNRINILHWYAKGSSSSSYTNLDYFLWRCYPEVLNPTTFPKIARSYRDRFYRSDSEHFADLFLEDVFKKSCHSREFSTYFNSVDQFIKSKTIPADYVQTHTGQFMEECFEYWRGQLKRVIAFLGACKRSRLINKDVAKIIAQMVYNNTSIMSLNYRINFYELYYDGYVQKRGRWTIVAVFQYVKYKGDLEVASYLEKYIRRHNARQVFSWALDEGCVEAISISIEMDPSINTKENLSMSLFSAVKHRYTKIVQELLSLGADPNYVAHDGQTPFSYAVECSSERIVRLLLEYGAQVNHPRRYGKTPIFCSINYGKWDECERIVRLLLEYGAQVNHPRRNDGEETLLQCAIRMGYEKIVEILLNAGVTVDRKALAYAERWYQRYPKTFQLLHDTAEKQAQSHRVYSSKSFQFQQEAAKKQAQRKKSATIVMGLGKYKMGMFKSVPQGLTRQIAQMIVNPALTMKAV